MRRRRQVEHHRHQQPLRLEAARRQPLHHPLEQHALVRDVLIDDRNPLVVDRDDERVAELAERNHRPDARSGRCGAARGRSLSGRGVRARADGSDGREADRIPVGRLAASGIQRLGNTPPARTPGMRRRRRRSARRAPGCSCSCGTPPCPSASISARRTTSCTSDCSRNRTSAFVGCTLTSTASGGISMNRCTSGLRSLIDADAVGVDDRVRDRPVLDDAAVDEDVLRPARRPLLGQRRDVAGQPQAAGLLAHLEQVAALAVQLIQPIAQRSRPAGTASTVRPPLVSVKPTSGYASASCVDDARDLRRLGAVGLQELPPRRQVVEEVVDLDDRALRRRRPRRPTRRRRR